MLSLTSSALNGEVDSSASLSSQLRDLMAYNEMLAVEKRMLEMYLEAHARDVFENMHFKNGANANNSNANANANERLRLTIQQKLAIANWQVSRLSADATDLEKKASKDIADLQAMLGETKIRINELKKEAYEFRRDIVIGAENKRTKKIAAEKIVRYYDGHLKAKDATVEKLRMKNATLKAQIQSLQTQLKQKEDQGESLHSIDFHQLQIENSQFNQTIKERNDELLRLKMTTGNTVQRLNAAKRALGSLMSDSRSLQGEIVDKEETLIRLTEELSAIEDELAAEKRKNDRLLMQTGNSDMPHITDYMDEKAREHDLQQEIRNYHRKIEIAQMGAAKARRVIKQLRALGALPEEQQEQKPPSRRGGGSAGRAGRKQ